MRNYFAADAALIVVLLGAAAAHAQPAQERPSSKAVFAIEQAVVDAISRAEPSVVAISRSLPQEANPAEQRVTDVFGELRQPATKEAHPVPVASGVIIDRAGLVLTEYLAVREGDVHKVHTIEGKTYSAEIRAADPRSGLAVLKITPSAGRLQQAGSPANNASGDFPAITFADAAAIRKGQYVIAIGNPFAIVSEGKPTASLGIITNIAQKAPAGTNLNNAPGPNKDFRTTIHHLGTLLQTDARLGWSAGGGALVNLRGELVGLTTIASVIAGHEQPAGYAIPLNATIRRVIEALKEGREPEYGMLGVGFGPDVSATGVASGSPVGSALTAERPLRIAVVYPTSPAARAGIQPSDVITHVNEQPVDDVDSVQLGVSALPPNATIDIGYLREGREATAQVTLAKLAVAGNTIATARPEAWRGMRIDYATTLDARALKHAIDSGALDKDGCVQVTDVERDSDAWRLGVRPGMFVSHVAGKRVSTPAEFREAVKMLDGKFDLKFTTSLASDAAAGEELD